MDGSLGAFGTEWLQPEQPREWIQAPCQKVFRDGEAITSSRLPRRLSRVFMASSTGAGKTITNPRDQRLTARVFMVFPANTQYNVNCKNKKLLRQPHAIWWQAMKHG